MVTPPTAGQVITSLLLTPAGGHSPTAGQVDAPLLLAAPAPEAALAIMNGDAAVDGDKGSEMDNEGGGGPVDAEMAALLATNLWIDCKEAREYRPHPQPTTLRTPTPRS